MIFQGGVARQGGRNTGYSVDGEEISTRRQLDEQWPNWDEGVANVGEFNGYGSGRGKPSRVWVSDLTCASHGLNIQT